MVTCTGINEIATDLGCLPQDSTKFTALIYGWGLGIVGGVAMIYIIYGGYLVLSSKGNDIQLKKGKDYIVGSIAGILLAVLGFTIYQIIAADILKIPNFK